MGTGNIETCNDSLALLRKKINFLFDAETMIEKAFEEMSIQAKSSLLKSFFQTHRLTTDSHISMLLDIFVLLGIEQQKQLCHGCAGLLLECREILQSVSSPSMIDTALLTAIQEIEHYETASYKATVILAQQAGQSHIADILKQILAQQYQAENNIDKLAQTMTKALRQAQTN